MAAADQLKMEDLDHEAYESENLQDTSDYTGDNGAADGDSMMEDPELEAIKARVREMEEEAEKLKMLQSEVEKQISSPQGVTSPLNMSIEDKMEVDGRSVYVGNVDYGATAEELEQHFHGCGSINRVTILCNKYDGHPKGFAYVEFGDKDSVQSEVEKQISSPQGVTSPLNMSIEDKMEVDGRSVYVGNVDYGATAEELEQHFHGCVWGYGRCRPTENGRS
nr:EOG090X0FQT [Polyphemus pediculus]